VELLEFLRKKGEKKHKEFSNICVLGTSICPRSFRQKCDTLFQKQTKSRRIGDMAQVIEHVPSKYKDTTKRERKIEFPLFFKTVLVFGYPVQNLSENPVGTLFISIVHIWKASF
jgi:hypothetical protein